MLVKTVPSSYLFLCFNCLFTYHWDIIPPTFEWHFSYISQWQQWIHACVHVFMYHALLSVYKLACFWSDLFISNLIFCLSVQRGKETGYGHKMWRTKIHEGNFFFEIYKCYMHVNAGCFKEVWVNHFSVNEIM